MHPAIVIYLGTRPRNEIKKKFKELMIQEYGRIPENIREISIDTDYSGDSTNSPDILLNRENVKNVLKNPEAYGLNLDSSDVKSLNKLLLGSSKGALLDYRLGRLHYFANINDIYKGCINCIRTIQQGVNEEKARGSHILDKILCPIIASAGTGTGAPGISEIVSLMRHLCPNAVIILFTTFTLCPSALEPSLHKKVQQNFETVKKELIYISRGEPPNTFYPHLKNGELHYCHCGDLTVPISVPDYVFSVVPKYKTLEEVEITIALLLRDIILRGIPIELQCIENEFSDLDGNVISVTAEFYKAPTEDLKNYLISKGWRRQVEITFVEDTQSHVLAEDVLQKLFELD